MAAGMERNRQAAWGGLFAVKVVSRTKLEAGVRRGRVGRRRLLPGPGIRTQAPDVPGHQSFKADVMLFEAGELGNPNDPKFHFVLAVLDRQLAANRELAADEPQPDAGFGNVQSMG